MEGDSVGVSPIPRPKDVVRTSIECESSLFQNLQEKFAVSSTISEEDLGAFFVDILKKSEIRGQAVYIAHQGELVKLGGENGQLSLADMKKLIGDFHEANTNETKYLISAMVGKCKKLLEGISQHNSAQSAAEGAVSGSQGVNIFAGGAATPLLQEENGHGEQTGLGSSDMGKKLYQPDRRLSHTARYSQKQAMQSMHRALNRPVEEPLFSNTALPAQQPPPPTVPRGRGRGRPRKYPVVTQAPGSGSSFTPMQLQGQKQDTAQDGSPTRSNGYPKQPQRDIYEQVMQAYQLPPPSVPRGRGRPRKYPAVHQAPNNSSESRRKQLQGQTQDGGQAGSPAHPNTSPNPSQRYACQQVQVYQMQHENIQQQMEHDMQQRAQGPDAAALEGSIQPELRSMFQQVMQGHGYGHQNQQHNTIYASTSANSAQSLVEQHQMSFPANVDPRLLSSTAASGSWRANVQGSHGQHSKGGISMAAGQVSQAATPSDTYPGVQSSYGDYPMYGSSMAQPEGAPSSSSDGYSNVGSTSGPDFMGEEARANSSMSFYSSQAYGSQFSRPPASQRSLSNLYFTNQGWISQASAGPVPMTASTTTQSWEQPAAKRPRSQTKPTTIMPRADMRSLRAATDPATQNSAQTLPPCTRTTTMSHLAQGDTIIEWPSPTPLAPGGRQYYILTCPMPKCKNRTFGTPKGMSVHMTQFEIGHADAMGTNRSHTRVVDLCGVKVIDATPETVAAHNASAGL